ncbi:MAG TPA: DinB family protein [Acidimicrobiales bacterium]|jgi:hypothetical protein|nr:DinB family protein [Acidimicrobiales bacterium]
MPIPAPADGDGATNAVLSLFRQLHGQLRDEVNRLDADALNWVPVTGANSIATIITHLIGSEAETLRSVAGLQHGRDRAAEFRGTGATTLQILDLIGQADSLVSLVEPDIASENLEATFSLPTLPADEQRTGLTWLVGNYGHAREHLGEIQLTSQLYAARRPTERDGAGRLE